MSYTPIQFTQPLIDFIGSCPFLETDGPIEAVPYMEKDRDSAGLQYVGTKKQIADQYADGGVTLLKQADFVLQFWCTDPPVSETGIIPADLGAALEEWVEYQNYCGPEKLVTAQAAAGDFAGIVPRFGTVASYAEQIWADSFSRLLSDDDAPETKHLYQIRLHVQYMVYYPPRTTKTGLRKD